MLSQRYYVIYSGTRGDAHTGADILVLIRDLHERLGATIMIMIVTYMIMIVTYDPGVTESCPRTMTLRDGRFAGDVRL